MKGALDINIHENPGTGAALLHWMAKGHAAKRPDDSGILIPWAMLGLGLLMTDDLRAGLPKNGRKFELWINDDGAKEWIGDARAIILAWKNPFWQSIAYGLASQTIKLTSGRIHARQEPSEPEPGSHASSIRRQAIALGQTFGEAGSEFTIGRSIALEFTE